MKKSVIIVIIIAVIVLAGLGYLVFSKYVMGISNFQECVDAGNPVMESLPRQCATEDGTIFIDESGSKPGSVCGNDLCEEGEADECGECDEGGVCASPCVDGTCPQDCTEPVCGNQICEEGEATECTGCDEDGSCDSCTDGTCTQDCS